MMVDFAIAAERDEHLTTEQSIRKAALLRFRPIMMTTMAAMLGGVPLMLGHGTGAELRQPLGYAMVGGLIVSQALTLFTTPVIYLYLDRLSHWLSGSAKRSDDRGTDRNSRSPVGRAPTARRRIGAVRRGAPGRRPRRRRSRGLVRPRRLRPSGERRRLLRRRAARRLSIGPWRAVMFARISPSPLPSPSVSNRPASRRSTPIRKTPRIIPWASGLCGRRSGSRTLIARNMRRSAKATASPSNS